jgi:hypothetical protein
MCLGSKPETKVEMPKPPPLPPPLPPPPPPAPPKPAAKNLVEPDRKVDVRIGQAKRPTTGNRSRGTSKPGKQSLSIGNNQGMTL